MINDSINHITKLSEFQERHSKLRKKYNSKGGATRRLREEMEAIRYTCQMYMQHHNLLQHLSFGASTPQVQAELNDFDSICDFHEIVEGVIIKLKIK